MDERDDGEGGVAPADALTDAEAGAVFDPVSTDLHEGAQDVAGDGGEAEPHDESAEKDNAPSDPFDAPPTPWWIGPVCLAVALSSVYSVLLLLEWIKR